jgi:RimJ/RimL family protein N-acetyltransferase
MSRMNELGQPIGFALPEWSPPPLPPRTALVGRFCRVEPLDAQRHAADLHAANARDADGRMWTYLPYGPFATVDEYTAWVEVRAVSSDPCFYAIVDTGSERAVGVASYLRFEPAAGSIEVGNLAFSPLLQRMPAATEAMFLLMRQAFSLGYRRYEWKCDALNAPSRAAAERLGFTFEGIFRQATVYKRRNRDTAWYAIIDSEWPGLARAYAQWLDPANFDAAGRQRARLADLIAAARA